MSGFHLMPWWAKELPSDAKQEVAADIRQALTAVGSPLLSWLDQRTMEEAS